MYESFILGQITRDINIDHEGNSVKEFGGAVIHSGFAAANTGHKIAALPKVQLSDIDPHEAFEGARDIALYPLDCPESTWVQNQYHTPDKERRTCTVTRRSSPYLPQEIPDVKAQIYHIAGLMHGDLGNEIVDLAAERAKVALDVQGMLRWEENGSMVFRDWAEKMEYLPKIDFLKTDAAEAEILTGLTDREAAAKLLYQWGAKEVLITHNTEVLVYDGERTYVEPIKSRTLQGRSGRGDTCFSVYICERLTKPVEEALLFATATVSLKMEKHGPFKGTRQDVDAYIKEFYSK